MGAYNFKDLTGKKFYYLLVLNKTRKDKNGHWYWKCKCDCGNIKEILGSHLIQGNVKSCGCYNSKRASKFCKDKTIIPNKRIMYIWQSMKQRCYNQKSISYKNYGAKGIKICDEWKNNPKLFYNWAIENGYNEKAKYGECTIDRIDVNGNYEPSNCRWIPMNKQVLNTSKNHYLELNEEKYTVYEWSIITGIKSSTILQRINKYHWSVKRALTEKPFKGKNQYYEKEVKSNE